MITRWTAVFLCCIAFAAGSMYASVVGAWLRGTL
jgi:hypothetical protein